LALFNNALINEDLPAPLGAEIMYKLPCNILFSHR